jgi:hypothetical protein
VHDIDQRSVFRSCAARLALASLIALAIGCTSGSSASRAGGKPDWVRGRSSEFPQHLYVTGFGVGSAPETARDSARAEIARIFRSQVESSVSSQTIGTTHEVDGRARSQVIETLEIATRVAAEGDFEGLYIAETWRERSTGTYYALAVLDKEKMRKVLLAELRSAADRVHGDLVRFDSAATNLGRSKALIAAVRASGEVDAIVARARLVGRPRVIGLPGRGEIERDLDQTLWDTRFEVRAIEVDAATGAPRGELPKLREQLEEMITRIGFKVAGSGRSGISGPPNVWLTCRMSLEEVPRDLATHFVRWEGVYELTGAPPGGPVVLASESSGGASYATARLARTRALTKGSSQLARDLEQQISRYLGEPGRH